MTKPKMILFDAGRTLLDYVSIDTMKGVQALMPYITSNPRGLSAGEIDRCTNEIFSLFEISRKKLFEVPELTILNLAYDLLELKFSIPLEEIERIIWASDAEKIPTKHAAELLDALNALGIQTGVISNLDFSGDLLRDALDTLFPNNHFHFVIASSDYGIRKPHPYIFEAAIAKSGFPAKDIWYVGDKLSVDVEGSQKAGMVPVLYKCPRNNYSEIPNDVIVIEDFLELLDHLNEKEVR